MGRLVVVSNRLPLGDNPSGGLVVALKEALADGGVWVGNAGVTEGEPSAELESHPGAAFDRLSFDVTEAEHAGYYLGYANSVLWPLCHRRVDLLEMRPDYLSAYRRVNRRIARMVARIVGPGDRIWVQDYHHLPLAHELRALGVKNPLGLFLHIPFPGPMAFQALPNAEEVARWIAAFDLFGLQGRRDVSACLEAFRTIPETTIRSDGRMAFEGSEVRVAAFPIGIDVDDFLRAAEKAGPRPDGPALIIGVDRLDYSKGIPQRFRAFADLLDRRPDLAGQVELLQIAPPTREAVQAYRDIREDLEQLTGRINGEHADLDWTPIRYIHRAVPRERLAVMFRHARVGLVTPLADGMNLVAKEFVCAQDPDDPGVLLLSKFAGAAEQMGKHALIVNPHDAEEMAQQIVTALWMSRAERQERHGALMAGLRTQDVHWWRRTFLSALDAASGHSPKLVSGAA